MNNYSLEGAIGNQMQIPLTNSWPVGNSSVSESTSLINDGFNFNPTTAPLTVNKRGAGSTISEEALEDGGLATVSNAIVTRLSGAIAKATDIAGFRVALSGSETALTDIANVNVGADGVASGTLGTDCDLAVVMSPEAVAYAVKRQPTVKMFNDVSSDDHDMVATVRNGFAQLRTDFIRSIATNGVIGGSNGASLDQFSTSVANLRAANSPTLGGYYWAFVTPAQELALAKELNGVGGISSGSIGSVAQDLANDALLQGLITQAIGCQFVRSNNLPQGISICLIGVRGYGIYSIRRKRTKLRRSIRRKG